SANAAITSKPRWDVDPKAHSTVFRFFPKLSSPGKPGSWGFGHYYANDGKIRICRIETAKGVAVCVNSTTTSGERYGAGKVAKWDVDATLMTVYRRFFENL